MNMAMFSRGMSAPAFAPVRPGLRYGPAPLGQRSTVRSTPLDRWVLRLRSKITSKRVSCSGRWLNNVKERVAIVETLAEVQYQAEFKQLTLSVRRKGHDASSVDIILAHAVIAARRTLALTPHDVQLMAVRELLRGRFVEMGTGEGKTLTMALAAAVSAFDGTPVHVLTASDYLAERDATNLSPLYQALGLSVAFVLPEMTDDERRAAYQANVVHVTGKQVAFDWLRDCVAKEESTPSLASQLGDLVRTGTDSVATHKPLLRGLCLAIIDEADSLLIDEARTPLILAAPAADNKIKHEESVVALTLARLLHEGVDFNVAPGRRFVMLTPKGEEALDTLVTRVEGLWRAARYRDERVRDALSVLHCWTRDRDYVVRDNQIELVDPHTGRALPDRRLQLGLHRLLELKERCQTTPENNVVASLPFQHFFLNYVRLSGMSGTLREVGAELACVYGAKVVCVPPLQPSQLQNLSLQVFPTTSAQLEALVAQVQWCIDHSRPVLVGTRTVKQSESVSSALSAHGIVHNLLNASQDAHEAAVVAQAGLAAQVTVATNMAGRGTDIRLGSGVSACGGLHVIALAFNDSYRLDRQLAGRAARQGDPGSFIRLLSLEDVSLANELPQWIIKSVTGLLTTQSMQAHAKRMSPENCQTGNLSQVRGIQRSLRYRGGLIGTAVANLCVLMLMLWVQMKIERKHAVERQRALDAASLLAHHIAIGTNSKFTS